MWDLVNPCGSFPGGACGKESACQCRGHRFDPWVRKILWRRKWGPTPVYLCEKSRGQRRLVDYSPLGLQEVGWDSTHTHTHTDACSHSGNNDLLSVEQLCLLQDFIKIESNSIQPFSWALFIFMQLRFINFMCISVVYFYSQVVFHCMDMKYLVNRCMGCFNWGYYE